MPQLYSSDVSSGTQPWDRGYWVPHPEMTHFNGTPLPGDLDFFVRPPSEIGTILYAHSTLRRGKVPWDPGARLFLAAAGGLFGGVLGLVVLPAMDATAPVLAAVPALMGIWIAWLATRFKHRCYYVGTTGCAYFRCGGTRERLITNEVFVFQPGLRCEATTSASYQNGWYQSTSYNVTWKDSEGRVLYTIKGSHSSKNNTPPLDDDFWYALAAHAAWGYYEKMVFAIAAIQNLNLHGEAGSK